MSEPAPSHPATDRNLLFGVLALQADLIDPGRFAEACAAWSARKDTPLADLLVERGWLTPTDLADIEKLLQRKLAKHKGDAGASLAHQRQGESWALSSRFSSSLQKDWKCSILSSFPRELRRTSIRGHITRDAESFSSGTSVALVAPQTVARLVPRRAGGKRKLTISDGRENEP
jgi:hypothetical protein